MIRVLSILLLILKVIGWMLLGILGIILGILLFVLFSAIRYRIDGKKDEGGLEGTVRVTWLLHLLSVTALYQDGLTVTAKLLGRTIWKSEAEGKESGKDKEERTEEEAPPLGPEPVQVSKEAKPEPVQVPENTGQELPKPEKGDEPERKAETPPAGTLFSRLQERFSRLWKKLSFSFQVFCGKLKQIGRSAENLQKKVSELTEKLEKLQDFVQDPANRQSAGRILRQTGRMVRHILPRKGTADITFGLEDPYRMGQILAFASVVYPFAHRYLTLHPVFQEQRLEGEVHVCGHIRIGVLLGCLLSLLLDRNIRTRLWKAIRPQKAGKKGSSRTDKSSRRKRKESI